MHYRSIILALFIVGAGITACTQSETTPPPITDKSFTFDTTQKVNLDVSAIAQGEPVVGAPVRVYQKLDADGNVDEKSLMLEGITGKDGNFKTVATVPADLTNVIVRVVYIGLISEPIQVEIKKGLAYLLLDNQTITTQNVIVPKNLHGSNLKGQNLQAQAVTYNYKYLGGFGNWAANGVPKNLTTNSSKVTAEMLRTINATVPEGSVLPNHPTHSNYITRDSTSNLVMKQDGEVWMTFVHEGAGYKNSVGYYLYDAKNPPQTIDEVKDRMIMAYPNASYQGSGGGLLSAHRVQLKYYDSGTKTWSTTFPAGTGVGWFLVSNGWQGSSLGVQERSYEQTVFSDPVLNYGLYKSQKMTVAQSPQTVLLLDQGHETLLLGIEDILRHHGGDQDFNDAVLLIETSLVNVKTSGIVIRDIADPSITRTVDLKPVDDPKAADSDGDGVNDTFDAYPKDSSKAFESVYPSKDDYGTLIYEDLWPKTGDYDFNDVVIDYNIKQVANANNKLVEIQAEYVLKALGGGFHNGFAFSTDLKPSQISSVTYTWEKNGVVQTGNPPMHYTIRMANGLEAGQGQAVVPVFDDGYDILPPSLGARPYYSNVVPTEPYKTPGKVKVTIRLAQPIAMTDPGTPPYNPFVITNGVAWGRDVEVHLANKPPTQLAASNLFGRDQDTSNAKQGRYYIDTTGRPWAINLPTQFSYVREVLDAPGGSVSLGLDIRNAYLKFDSWLGTQGSSYKDWYRDMPNYREPSKLFSTTP